MLEMVEAKPKDADKFCFSPFQLLERDLMPIFEEIFHGFQAPHEGNCEDEHHGVNPFHRLPVGGDI